MLIKQHSVDYWIKNRSIDVSVKSIIGNVEVHRHEFYEIELILEGGGTYNVDGIDYPIKRGCLFAMSPISFHHINFTEDTRLVNFMFTLNSCDPDFLLRLFIDRPHYFTTINDVEIELFKKLAAEAIMSGARNDQITHSYQTAILNCILAKICSIAGGNERPNDISPIQYAILYLQNNFTHKISLEDVSKIANYSPNYFCNLFKKYTGNTFTEYLNNLRVSYAEKLLINTKLSVSQISTQSGYNDFSYFMSSFKAKYKTTPKKYRESFGKK